eukprot:CAMPEP_0194539334 /NCGR_PEP_ID=MMETSP0253-20130528/79267_1 /TAXON_ID=2966 /ORGANISM="Noctiluca scintillans" /LENGTH=38 /DNA_ID= /DNA_START= /DNA_END= /DNA_ORIENTATION=
MSPSAMEPGSVEFSAPERLSSAARRASVSPVRKFASCD